MHQFGELEAAIMDRVWAADRPLRVRDVVEGLRDERNIAYTTVQTVMEILYRKEWLVRTKEGRAHLYQATMGREDYAAHLVDQALASSANRTVALVRFVEQMRPSEIAELRQALDEANIARGTS